MHEETRLIREIIEKVREIVDEEPPPGKPSPSPERPALRVIAGEKRAA